MRLNITAGQTFTNSGFPNGRTLRDDVFTAEVNLICTTDPSMPLMRGTAAMPRDRPYVPREQATPRDGQGDPLRDALDLFRASVHGLLQLGHPVPQHLLRLVDGGAQVVRPGLPDGRHPARLGAARPHVPAEGEAGRRAE